MGRGRLGTRAAATLLAAALAAPGCKREPEAPVYEAQLCGEGLPECPSGQECVEDECMADTTPPAPPSLRDPEVVGESGSTLSLRIRGSAEKRSRVRVHEGVRCEGPVLALGTAEQLAGAGLVVDAVKDGKLLSLAATATDASGNSSFCGDVVGQRLPRPAVQEEDSDGWQYFGFDSEEKAFAAWDRLREAQARLRREVPGDVLGALARSAPDFRPVFVLGFPPAGNETESGAAHGDFNCDGRMDHALVGLDSGSPLAAALGGRRRPALDKLGRLFLELRTWSWEDAAEVQVALSSRGGWTWRRLAASKVANGGRFRPRHPLGCGLPTPGAADYAWAAKNRCDVLVHRCCEGEAVYVLWDQRSRELAVVGGCPEEMADP